jgi:Fusaric acid resistance protein family
MDCTDEPSRSFGTRIAAKWMACCPPGGGCAAGRGAPLLFGLRLWASVCLALYIAFYLELDNEYWAGLSAAIVCQPQLGASLRKGWYRIIGTIIGAVAIVVLTAWFPQALSHSPSIGNF